jgi:hypothetical protein
LWFVKGLARTSPSKAEQAWRRCFGQPDHTLCSLPSKRALFSEFCSQRFLQTAMISNPPASMPSNRPILNSWVDPLQMRFTIAPIRIPHPSSVLRSASPVSQCRCAPTHTPARIIAQNSFRSSLQTHLGVALQHLTSAPQKQRGAPSSGSPLNVQFVFVA